MLPLTLRLARLYHFFLLLELRASADSHRLLDRVQHFLGPERRTEVLALNVQ
jgi:hypothetical protein